MASFVAKMFMMFLWWFATGEKCYLQSECDHERVMNNIVQCKGLVGSVVELYCSFNNSNNSVSSSMDLTFEWQKAGEVLSRNASGKMKFNSFNPSDAGTYQCKAFSDGREVLCGKIDLITAPVPGKHCTINNNGNYHCDCIQEVHVENNCQQLLTVNVSGYPVPSISWFVSNSAATNDNQVLLTILGNGSVLVDVQLWSLAGYKDVSSVAHSEVGSAAICVWRSWLDREKPPFIYFNLSVTPQQLKEGASNVPVITCSSDAYIGDFYICYSRNLSGLGRLEVDDKHCCYCSREGSIDCMKKFPNWKLEYSEGGHRSTCLAKLQNVTEDDAGFYQCRVYDVTNYPCKRRYGNIYGYNVSTQHDDHLSSTIHLHGVTLASVIVFGVSITLIIVIFTTALLYRRCRKTHSYFMESKHREGERQPLLSQAPCDPRAQTQTAPCNDKHRAHVMHFNSEDTKQWVDNELAKMLQQMNVEEEYAIAGRLWLSECTRMIRKGYKVIVLISKDVVTSRFEIALNHVINGQDCRQPCLIPIMFNCELDDLHDDLQSLLVSYVILHHDDARLYDRLKQAICNHHTDNLC